MDPFERPPLGMGWIQLNSISSRGIASEVHEQSTHVPIRDIHGCILGIKIGSVSCDLYRTMNRSCKWAHPETLQICRWGSQLNEVWRKCTKWQGNIFWMWRVSPWYRGENNNSLHRCTTTLNNHSELILTWIGCVLQSSLGSWGRKTSPAFSLKAQCRPLEVWVLVGAIDLLHTLLPSAD